ncbi:MAG: hypothetical protein IJJ45_05310 [Clostridia bacterium]|nr:hypothetical protein [Clostridia bacterium]
MKAATSAGAHSAKAAPQRRRADRAAGKPHVRANNIRRSPVKAKAKARPRRVDPVTRLLKAIKLRSQRIVREIRRPKNPANIRTALWLWCFPVGLGLMWRGSCTWRKGVKIGITAAIAAILAAIFIIPTPTVAGDGSGVQLVADKPAVEVYGPALPALIVPGYTREKTGSIIVDKVASDVHYVYAADGARCYHEYECKFAFASSQRLTVYEAYHLGFEPCGRCKPPQYIPGVTDPVTAQPIDQSGAATTAATDGTDAAA